MYFLYKIKIGKDTIIVFIIKCIQYGKYKIWGILASTEEIN